MKKIDLGQTINTVANLGVIVGILLLVFELTQNRDMMRAQVRNELFRGLNDVLSPLIMDAGLAELNRRSNSGEEIDEAGAARLNVRDELTFRYFENVHYQYRQGLYDESEFSRQAGRIRSVVNGSPRLVRFWCESRMYYSIPFMNFMDSQLPTSSCQIE